MLRNVQFSVKYDNPKNIFYKLIDYHADRFDSLKFREHKFSMQLITPAMTETDNSAIDMGRNPSL